MTRGARPLDPGTLTPLPETDGGKDERGQVLVIGGSRAVPGAVLLAGESALRVGAGKLQIATVSDHISALALAVPEAMAIGLGMDADGNVAGSSTLLEDALSTAASVLCGPGTLEHPATQALVDLVLARAGCPVILDAGALRNGLTAPEGATVLVTPHAKEMAVMMGLSQEVILASPGDTAREFAQTSGCITVLKGSTTYLATPDGSCWIHEGGCSGLGTSGSGDVLAGALAGFIARGVLPVDAAQWAIVAHAQAGEELAHDVGRVGFLAREISQSLPAVLDDLARMTAMRNA